MRRSDKIARTISYMEGFISARQVRRIVVDGVAEPVVKNSKYDRLKRASEAANDMCYGRSFAERLEFLHQLTLHVNAQFESNISGEDFLSLKDCFLGIKAITTTMEVLLPRNDS